MFLVTHILSISTAETREHLGNTESSAKGPFFATSIFNDRKMCPLHSTIQNIRFDYRDPGEDKILNFYDASLSFQLTTAGQPAQCRQNGRHCLAGI